MLVSCLAYSSTLKMEATCSSEMSVDFQQTVWRYIPDDRTLHILFWKCKLNYFNNLGSARQKSEIINIPETECFLTDPSRTVIMKREFKDWSWIVIIQIVYSVNKLD
jgi:hypothetical protein